MIFTSDNGAEITAKTATGPVRSNKGSCYEGGHRVPFIVSWPKGIAKGKVSEQLIGLQDLYATFSEIMGVSLPDLKKGEKGAEDSLSLLPAWRGEKLVDRPMFYNDHKESKDGAASAMRLDDPKVGGTIIRGKWKLFFDASLLRSGTARPTALFDLASDPKEEKNRLDDPSLKRLVTKLVSTALLHRRVGGHRFVPLTPKKRVIFDWTQPIPSPAPMVMNLLAKGGKASMDSGGVGIPGSGSDRVDAGQGIALLPTGRPDRIDRFESRQRRILRRKPHHGETFPSRHLLYGQGQRRQRPTGHHERPGNPQEGGNASIGKPAPPRGGIPG